MRDARDLDREFQDNVGRKYAYDFDWVIRSFLLKRVTPHLKRDGKTLEIGAFMGDMSEQILAHFPNLTILEGSADLCHHLETRFGKQISIRHGLIETYKFEENFDTIFLVHTLEHLDNPVQSLRLIYGWLAPGGSLVVAVPNADALSRQIAVRMGLISTNTAVTDAERHHGHLRTYDMDSFLSDIRQSGLQVSDWGGVVLKPLSNGQFDQALSSELVSRDYVEACDSLSKDYPQFAATLYAVIKHSA